MIKLPTVVVIPLKRYRIAMLFCVLLMSVAGNAQLFIPVADDPFGVPLKFNQDSVRARKIRTVTSGFQYKPDGRIIVDQGIHDGYEFDTLGRLKLYWKMRVGGTESKVIEHDPVMRRGKVIKKGWSEYKYQYKYDTVFVYLYYDSLSRVTIRRMCDGNYYHSWYYSYNEDNTLSSQIHARETNVGLSHRDFKPGVQTILSQEDFRYEKYSQLQSKRLCTNDEGRVYKEAVLQFDVQGRMIESRESFVAGGLRVTVNNAFDSLGRVSKYRYNSNSGEEVTEETEYLYDSLGRLETVRKYKNTVLKDEYSYLYEGNSPIAYAYINRRHIELGIDIVKLQVEYYK